MTIARKVAHDMGVPLQEGVYAALTGPSYETPAEIRYLRTIGADLVGMSTVPEVIVANHMGIKVLGISVVTNLAAGISGEKLSHKEVLETGERRFVGRSVQLLRAHAAAVGCGMTDAVTRWMPRRLAVRENAHARLYSKFKSGGRGAGWRPAASSPAGNVENATYGLDCLRGTGRDLQGVDLEGARKLVFAGGGGGRRTDVLAAPAEPAGESLWEFCGDVELVMANLQERQGRAAPGNAVSAGVRRFVFVTGQPPRRKALHGALVDSKLIQLSRRLTTEELLITFAGLKPGFSRTYEDPAGWYYPGWTP